MDELKASGKPFQISKQEVWNAWLKVKEILRTLGLGETGRQMTRTAGAV